MPAMSGKKQMISMLKTAVPPIQVFNIFRQNIWNIFFCFGLFLLVPGVHAATVVNETGLISDAYTVPQNGRITITITGADGGAGSNTRGGSGATVTGVFDVTAGQVLRYVVGGAGSTHAGTSAGGGGSTGVYIDNTLVMVAGAGGGGDNSASPGADGQGGNYDTPGLSGTGNGAGSGGTGGNGGGANINDSAGGGGVNSPGESAAAGGGGQAIAAPALPGLLVIAQGGSGSGTGSAGGDGFSGGGGADSYYSGGGGGYSGGGAAGANGSAGGGGSYANTGATGYVSSTLTAGTDGGGGSAGNEADGSILVDFTGSYGLNPLPAGDANNAPDICNAAGAAGDLSNISGVVNTYFPGSSSVASGATSLSIGPAAGASSVIAAGDLLMIIQMQDADMNTANTIDYGDGYSTASGSTDINQTGLYEFAVAANSVGTSGGTLNLQTGLTHAYNAGSNKTFQIIRVPRYNNLILGGDIVAQAWNGSTGGVVVLDVLDTLDFNGYAVKASTMVTNSNGTFPDGLGFRPGKYVGGDSTVQDATNPDYVAVGIGNDTDLWAEKGEGIAGTPGISYLGGVNDGYPNGNLARGAPGNAGGGGNDHNGGGGGGSNIGYGGQGGDGWLNAADAGGRGGGSFAGYNGRLLMGGGGGAANANNNSTAGSGAAGGGLVFINATNITGTGTIEARGGRGLDSNIGYPAGNDGAGGGGGGGTIVLRTATPSIPGLTLDVRGGDGGDVITANAHGPGGGGGGGAIYTDAAVGSSLVDGGTAGFFYSTTSPPPPPIHHGATDGGSGRTAGLDENNLPVPIGCDYPDEPGYNSAGTVHQFNPVAGGASNLYLGSGVDYEWIGSGNTAASVDDDRDTSGTGAGNDENGVTFYSPGGNQRAEVYADVSVVNDSGTTAYICAWLDRWDNTGHGNGSYDAGDIADTPAQACQSVVDNNGNATTVTFYWGSNLPQVTGSTYARFRVCTTQAECSNPSSTASDGEVEAYQINFDFQPTAVTIGRVELEAIRVPVFLDELGVEQMDNQALLTLLRAWDPVSAASLPLNAGRDTILAALQGYLDPDGNDQVAIFSWETLEERGTIGFFVDRRQGKDAWTRINNNMLPGLINAPMGGEYKLADPGVISGSYQYRLIEQEARGTTRAYGPFEIRLP